MHMSINAYNASTISALFAGLNNSSSGTSLSYGIDFTTYNSIKNGSYSKLMRKYYSNQASESTNGATANKNTGKVHSIDIQKNNATVNRDNEESLEDSASELKKYSLWSKVDKTDKDGNKVTSATLNLSSYNTEASGTQATYDAIVAAMGKIKYVNNGNNVQTFELRIPVEFTYTWGTVKTTVDCTVKSTMGN